jgi:hypothetical protein
MPLLILAIASFLSFLVIVILMWVAETLESRTIDRKRKLLCRKPSSFLAITDAFDPVYAVLWDAPIAALRLIGSAGSAGLPATRVRRIYADAAAHFPEVYDGWSFIPWLDALEDMQLITWHGPNVVLTPDGRAFLKFRFVSNTILVA